MTEDSATPSPQTSYSKTAELIQSAKSLSLSIKSSGSREHTLNFNMQKKGLFHPQINRMQGEEERKTTLAVAELCGKGDW